METPNQYSRSPYQPYGNNVVDDYDEEIQPARTNQCKTVLPTILSIALVVIGILGMVEVLPLSVGSSLVFFIAGGFVFTFGMIQNLEKKLLEKIDSHFPVYSMSPI